LNHRKIIIGEKLMQMKVFYTILIIFIIPFSSFSASEHSHKSKYSGQEKREIKSLSESDIEELKKWKRMGISQSCGAKWFDWPGTLAGNER
jgi:hypothetical protein